jgi:uncharacterized tellurite resistance protein B-like protein
MSIVKLATVKKLFGGSTLTKTEQKALADEVMLMTLARATASDTNIKNVEVDKVKEVLLEHTGKKFTNANVRVAANSKMYEAAPLERYLSKCSRRLTTDNRLLTVKALEEIIHADGRVSDHEVAYFNRVASALELTPAQLVGLASD